MNTPLPPDPYTALGVDSAADAGTIKTAYRKLVLKCHPDKFPDPTLKAEKQEEFQRVQQAYEILGNEDKKREYDLEVKAKKLREELYKKGPATSTANGGRYVNVNVRTAEPPPGWTPSSKHSPPKEHEREAKLKAERKMRDREMKRKQQEAEEKARAKAKPYVEHSGFSEDEDVRKSPSKKPSKKHGDSPTREKPSFKQRERLSSRDEVPTEDKGQSTHEKVQSAMAYAAQYVQETKNKANKSSPPKVAADMPSYSAAYPDPNEKFAIPRRGSGDAKHVKGEPIIVDVPGPSKERSETINVSPTQQAPPRLQKSYTMPYVPQAQAAAPPPTRGHPSLTRSQTMQPDHFDAGRVSGEKHRSSRRRASFDEEEYFEQPRFRRYSINRDNKGAAPRTMETKYKDPYGPSPGAAFPKVRTAPAYGMEHVSTAKRYGNEEVLTSDYGQPSYAEYPTQAAY
ncbi:Chaperone protein DnaJ [Cytospora mali]|uniref:Chaperone protein DnaJ n=1 Tax=Cytospora mali TaxID=578113 RepID=A0A194V7Y7_CYTMA|nr:Chaperone protein DnaJ [Valsa mali var. pyri (nom. inval.)]